MDDLFTEDVFQETSARYRAVGQEQWLQRHPEAGSSWPSWPKASHIWTLLSAGGLMFGDDYAWPGVQKVGSQTLLLLLYYSQA